MASKKNAEGKKTPKNVNTAVVANNAEIRNRNEDYNR